MNSFDLSKQSIVQLEQIPDGIRRQIENENSVEYALDLSFNRLRKIEAIGIFEHVRQLDLSENQLENVYGLQVLRSLQSIDLSRNCIASIDLLALLPALQILKIAENSLTTIDFLQLLPELRVVDASYNRIAKWPLLAGLNLLEALDLSDNMLGSFSSSVSGSLFPFHLRRLSIARNQIDQLCGVACLGLHLPSLKLFDFDGNPIVLEIGRSGGQFERLFAAFFPNLPLGNDGGLTVSRRKHEDFAMLPHSLDALKRIILEGHEEDLFDFLVTGAFTSRDDCAGVRCVIPPPPPVERPPFRWKPSTTLQTGNLISPENKFKTCQRLQENGLSQISDFAPASSRVEREKAVRWREQSVLSNRSQNDARMPVLTTADLDGPARSSQFVPTCSISSRRPLDATVSASIEPMKNSLSLTGGEYDVLLKKLTDQVTTIRKYMKIWIRREKLVRIASASKIQRWLRRIQGNFELRQRVLRSRSRRQDEYSIHYCTFTTTCSRGLHNDPNAQRIQSLVRGFIVRQRIVHFKQKHRAACSIQHFWKKIKFARQEIFPDLYKWSCKSFHMESRILCEKYYTALRGMVRCSRDVNELQHVCAVQAKAISCLWSHQIDREASNKVVPENPNKSQQSAEISKMKCQIDQQTIELDRLKQQVETLQNQVADSKNCNKTSKQMPSTPRTSDENQYVNSEGIYKPQAEEKAGTSNEEVRKPLAGIVVASPSRRDKEVSMPSTPLVDSS